MKIPTLFIALSLLFGGLIFQIPQAQACSCMPPASPRESLEGASAVFIGKVTNVTAPQAPSYNITATFKPTKVWKYTGDLKEIKILTAQDSAACGIAFEKDKEYLVYAEEQDGALYANLCGRTALLADAQNEVLELGAATQTPSGEKAEAISQKGQTILLVLLILGLLAFATKKFLKTTP